jgi:hypothetical protein
MLRLALAVRSNQEKKSFKAVSTSAAKKGGSWSGEGSDTGTWPTLASFASQIRRRLEVNQISWFLMPQIDRKRWEVAGTADPYN